MSELLTEAEHRFLSLVGDLYPLACEIVGDADNSNAEHDLRDIATRLHDLQRVVMSQAAARAYPNAYRLLGEHGLISSDGPV